MIKNVFIERMYINKIREYVSNLPENQFIRKTSYENLFYIGEFVEYNFIFAEKNIKVCINGKDDVRVYFDDRLVSITNTTIKENDLYVTNIPDESYDFLKSLANTEFNKLIKKGKISRLHGNNFVAYRKHAVEEITNSLIQEISSCLIIVSIFNKFTEENDVLSKRIELLKQREYITNCIKSEGKEDKYPEVSCTIDLNGVKLSYKYLDVPQRTFTRYTEGYVRRGHTRKYKSGKETYIPQTTCKSRIPVGMTVRG